MVRTTDNRQDKHAFTLNSVMNLHADPVSPIPRIVSSQGSNPGNTNRSVYPACSCMFVLPANDPMEFLISWSEPVFSFTLASQVSAGGTMTRARNGADVVHRTYCFWFHHFIPYPVPRRGECPVSECQFHREVRIEPLQTKQHGGT